MGTDGAATGTQPLNEIENFPLRHEHYPRRSQPQPEVMPAETILQMVLEAARRCSGRQVAWPDRSRIPRISSAIDMDQPLMAPHRQQDSTRCWSA